VGMGLTSLSMFTFYTFSRGIEIQFSEQKS
jgi:hypothetical protein